MLKQIELKTTIDFDFYGNRLDHTLSSIFTDYSRNRIKEWILSGFIKVNGVTIISPKCKVKGGVAVEINAHIEEQERWLPQEIYLDVVWEDDHILVINKPQNFVVHPGAGTPDKTVLNALLYKYPELSVVPRAGIVHRLDKDTTGLMVVAKTIEAQTKLVNMLQKRLFTREYEAFVNGTLVGGGQVNQPIGRHPLKRTLMSVNANGKQAITHFRVATNYRAHSRIILRLETGRTHQIRVHMSYISHPLIGDTAYGGRPRIAKNTSSSLKACLQSFPRQALHARMLRLNHPITNEEMSWKASLPNDMELLKKELEEDFKIGK